MLMGSMHFPQLRLFFFDISRIIATLFCRSAVSGKKKIAVAWGVFFCGLIQALFQCVFGEAAIVANASWFASGVKQYFALMGPALFGVSVSSNYLLLDTVAAVFLQTGSFTWIVFVGRLYELPLGIFCIAIVRSFAFFSFWVSRQVFYNWIGRCVFYYLIAISVVSLLLFMLAEALIATFLPRRADGTMCRWLRRVCRRIR